MRRNRVRFIPMFGRQSFKVDGKHHFYGGVNIEAVGGGWGLVDQLIKQAERLGVEIRYGTGLRRLLQNRSGAVCGVHVMGPDGYAGIYGRNVVLACGGFEANPEMRVRYYGPGWESCRVRGTRYNPGDGLRAALEIDAQAFGGWSTCHAVQWDISAPAFGDRVVLDNFQKHSYPIGIIVNLNGERFVDEGADYRNHTYAKSAGMMGNRSAGGPDLRPAIGMVRDEYRIHQATKAEADLEELAAVEIDGLSRRSRVQCRLQPGVQPGDPRRRATSGITPPKSNWALPIDKPPYTGFVVTCGITFSFGGLRITARCEVQDTSDRSIPGLYAAGEIVGGIFYENYLGGAGLMSGAVFGRIAGASAAQRVIPA
jgi:tricarballylate dehydrogenase